MAQRYYSRYSIRDYQVITEFVGWRLDLIMLAWLECSGGSLRGALRLAEPPVLASSVGDALMPEVAASDNRSGHEGGDSQFTSQSYVAC